MEGIIYKTQSYKEHSRLLFVYTNEGKKTLLAQGSQKLNSSYRILAQYLNLIAFTNNNKSFQVLKDGVLIKDYQEIKTDFHKTKMASVILEIVDKTITDDEEHLNIYNEIMAVLNNDLTMEMILSFALKILKYLGFALYLKPDGRKIKGVNINTGGLVYEDDNNFVDLDAKEAINLLKLYLIPYNELEQLTQTSLNKIKIFVSDYYKYHLQIELKNI